MRVNFPEDLVLTCRLFEEEKLFGQKHWWTNVFAQIIYFSVPLSCVCPLSKTGKMSTVAFPMLLQLLVARGDEREALELLQSNREQYPRSINANR